MQLITHQISTLDSILISANGYYYTKFRKYEAAKHAPIFFQNAELRFVKGLSGPTITNKQFRAKR